MIFQVGSVSNCIKFKPPAGFKKGSWAIPNLEIMMQRMRFSNGRQIPIAERIQSYHRIVAVHCRFDHGPHAYTENENPHKFYFSNPLIHDFKRCPTGFDGFAQILQTVCGSVEIRGIRGNLFILHKLFGNSVDALGIQHQVVSFKQLLLCMPCEPSSSDCRWRALPVRVCRHTRQNHRPV